MNLKSTESSVRIRPRLLLLLVALFSSPSFTVGDDKSSTMEAYEQSAMTRRGNANAGKRLFHDKVRGRCVICHAVAGTGGDVGPNLSNIGSKFDRPHLIESLLYPSRQIVEGYRPTNILMHDGTVLTGIIKKRTKRQVTLADAQNETRDVAVEQIEQQRASDVSIMPDGLQKLFSKSEFANLVAYLETLRASGKRPPGANISGPIALPDGFGIETIATGLTGSTALQTLADGRVLICEQTGTLRVVKDGKLLQEPALTLAVDQTWERGLIGVTVDPSFPKTPFVYVVYVAAEPYPHHRISRFSMTGDQIDRSSEKILLRGDDQTKLGGHVPAGHQGGAIHFGPDGMLYVGIGEHTNAPASQRMNTFQGKLLRISPDGAIPEDNPFLPTTSGKYQAIYALGLRNPYTFAFNPTSGELLVNDVGGKFEEINPVRSGVNYGWPDQQHGPHQNKKYGAPTYWYPESSIAGGDFIPEDLGWPQPYHGKYFFADFVHGWVKTHVSSDVGKADQFASGFTRPVDLRFGRDGLYVLTRNAWVIDDKFKGGTGTLLRIFLK